MKFKVSMKDPDTLHDAITDALKGDLTLRGFDPEELEAVTEVRRRKLEDVCSTWFKYGEYLTVEVDTDERTCTVVKS